MPEDVEEAVTLQHFLPKIAGTIARVVLRVPGTALHLAGMATTIKWQKVRCVPAKARRHVNFIRVGGEMYKRPCLELEQGSTRITVGLILPYRVTPGLTSPRILQLASRDRQ